MAGNFDPARFQATIRQFGFTEQKYIAEQRRVSLRRQIAGTVSAGVEPPKVLIEALIAEVSDETAREIGIQWQATDLSLIHISEPTRLLSISYAVFCLKKKKQLIK